MGHSSVKLRGRIGNAAGLDGEGIVQIHVIPHRDIGAAPGITTTATPVKWAGDGSAFEVETIVRRPDEKLSAWNEFNPRLYEVEAGLAGGTTTVAATFGFRNLATKDRQIILNERPVLLRGPVDECVYPLTGYPPMDKAAWRRVLDICRSYGFNHVQVHSWCPPEAAF